MPLPPSKRNSFKASRWLPAVFWMALIFYFSSQTGQPRYPWLATVGHIVEYSILTALYLFALVQTSGQGAEQHDIYPSLRGAQRRSNPGKAKGGMGDFKKRFWRISLTAFFLSSFYGFTDELHQYFVPGRFADPMDWLVDSLAALVVITVFVFSQHFNKTV